MIALVAEGERELGKIADAVFTVPDAHPLMSPILFTIPLQLLAYHIAVLRGSRRGSAEESGKERHGRIGECWNMETSLHLRVDGLPSTP